MEALEQRSLVFDEGTSDKFWSIRVDGSAHTVHFGRAGTAGQARTKAFATPEQATADADRLTAEKLRKGYREVAAAAPVPAGSPPPTAAAARVAAEPEAAPVAEPEVARAAPAADDRPPIDLRPEEWSLATWRPLHDRPDAEPAAFDPKRLREVARAAGGEQAGWGRWSWPSSPITFPMSREEAVYWLRLGQPLIWRETPLKRHAAVLEQPPELSAQEAVALARTSQLPEGEVMAPLLTLLGPERTLELLLTARDKPNDEAPTIGLFAGVRAYLLPELDRADRDRLRERAGAWLADELRDPDYLLGDAAVLAAQVGGLHEQVEELCGRWHDGWFSDTGGSGSYSSIAFGVGSATALEELVDRVKMRFATGREVAGFLAHTELRRLDWLVTSALRQESRDAAVMTVTALAIRVNAVEAAPAMLELMVNSRAPSVARDWLGAHPLQTARGLVPFVSRSGQLAEAARDQLKRMARGPSRPVLEELAAGLDGPDRDRLQQRVLDAALPAGPELEEAPPWLAEAAERLGGTALPPWLDPASLPPLEVDGGSLGARHLPAVLRILRAGADAPDPAVAALCDAGAPGSAEELAWSLFDEWLAADSPSKDKWALVAMGHLGGDRCALRLAPLIRAWPGESQHKRAVIGLGVLRGIGTDVALMQLDGIAQKLKFKALQARAREAMEEIAQDRGMTKGELEDRIVPDCGLDEQGRRVFDFGPRQFAFVLGPGMKPMLRDGAGKLRTSPPKPGAKDDEALATAAVADWKVVRKTVADVAKVQGGRLEQAMVGGRRWPASDFEALLVRHPLQRHIVAPLVLGTYAEDGALEATFRLTDEGDYADADDEPFALPSDARVGIVHPLALDDAQRAAWGEVLADYELVPPFPQLGRPVYELAPDDLEARDITRFASYAIAPGALVRILENLDWNRGDPQDAGAFHLHSKYFAGADATAILQYESGIPVGYITDAEDQRVTHLYVIAGHGEGWDFGYGLEGYRGDEGRLLRWRDVEPVMRSEILSDVQHLVAKAQP
jgi:predicted DNA-binding WGR domain protein